VADETTKSLMENSMNKETAEETFEHDIGKVCFLN